MTIVGISQKAGVYEGTPFDNVTFHCTELYEQGKGIGSKVKSFKVKRKVLTEIFGKELTEKELAALVGQTAEFYFDEYQSVKLIEVVQQRQK